MAFRLQARSTPNWKALDQAGPNADLRERLTLLTICRSISGTTARHTLLKIAAITEIVTW